MSARAGLCALLTVWLWALVSAASAQSPSAQGEPDIGGESKAEADDGAEVGPAEEARRLYAEGKGEYAQGRFLEAIALFERAYALSEAPGLLFNLAQAHRLAGDDHCPRAVALYKSYLAALPAAENRREVNERVQELSECASIPAPPQPEGVAPATVAPPPVTHVRLKPSPPPVETRETPRVLGPAMTAVGIALFVAGGALYARAAAKHREAESVCPCYPGAYSKWEKLTNVSYAAMGVGGAAAVGGVSWWVFGAASAAAPAHATLGLRGRF